MRPRVALFASINTPERTFIEVCKGRAIPTVEVQHGVIGTTDLCYAFPPNVPLRAFADWRIRTVPRSENARADELVNRALDGFA